LTSPIISYLVILFFFYCHTHHRFLPSFPTRRSSDLDEAVYSHPHSPGGWHAELQGPQEVLVELHRLGVARRRQLGLLDQTLTLEDRKSTRLNSSHVSISYAVFCLKKKKTKIRRTHTSDILLAVRGRFVWRM